MPPGSFEASFAPEPRRLEQVRLRTSERNCALLRFARDFALSNPAQRVAFEPRLEQAEQVVAALAEVDRVKTCEQRATGNTGEGGAGWSSGGARRATFEVYRIDSELRKTGRSAQRRELPAREIAELAASSEF